MPNRKRRSNRGGRKSRGNAFHHAPTQGVGETENWTLNDAAVVQVPSAFNGQLVLRVCADVNGFSFTVTQGGTTIVTSPVTSPYNQTLYAERNEQFGRLAQLWQEYRVDHVTLMFQPCGAGDEVQATSNFTVVDETGLLQGVPNQQDLLQTFSSQRTLKIRTPYLPSTQQFNYGKWLGQTQERAWIQTQQPAAVSPVQVIRQVYETNITTSNPASPLGYTPALVMVSGYNFSGSNDAFLGTISTRVKFSFRQRRPVTDDLFRDQTLFYERDGRRFMTKVDAKLVGKVLQEQEEEKQEEEEELELEKLIRPPKQPLTQPDSQCVSPFDSLSRSQLVATAELYYNKSSHPPAHLQGRVGEAQNPGPASRQIPCVSAEPSASVPDPL